MTRRLRDRKKALEKHGTAGDTRTTVRTYAERWLAARVHAVRPTTHTADAACIHHWIIPTIGHRRLHDLTPGDIRAVERAQRDAGGASSSALRTRRVLMRMLRDAVDDGHHIAPGTLTVKAWTPPPTDRLPLSVPEALAVLEVASRLPHGSRYMVALLQGLRQGEALGLTWDAVDLAAGTITVEWQLQELPYVDRKDKGRGFRVPDDYEARHLVGRFHLTRPKTRKGVRVVPMVPWVADALEAWSRIAPPNPWGLVWTRDGQPIDKKDDTAEWQAVQTQAGVSHPSRVRRYHMHEARHTTATLLMEAGVDETVRVAILGHSSITVTRGYQHADQAHARLAIEQIGRRLQLPAAGEK